MDQNTTHKAGRILELTQEIIHLVTGEDYTIVKKSSGECVTPRVSGGPSRTQSSITKPPPQSLIHEQNILELNSRITELLTGEVPIRCQDISVYFTTEEWEYIERHKDLYEEVIMEDHQSLTSPDASSSRCLINSQDLKEEEQYIPLDHQEGSLEERSGGSTSGLENSASRSEHGEDGISYSNSPHVRDQSRRGSKRAASSEGGEPLRKKSHPSNPETIEIDESPECGESSSQTTNPIEHPSSQSADKPYVCSDCGRCFGRRAYLFNHLKIHTGVKPFSCSECGKSFREKSHLVIHKRIHTGERPYSCTECKRAFSDISSLVKHLRTHSGEKPYSCSECGKSYGERANLVKHQRVHTGEMPYLCPDCGRRFAYQTSIVAHQKTHLKEKK